MKIIRVGVDLAKSVFQVHGVDRSEKVVWRKKLGRAEWLAALLEKIEPGCEIGMEACGGAHHWARQLQMRGYTVKLIAPQFVKPYVKSNKNDANDAEAICEAMSRRACVSWRSNRSSSRTCKRYTGSERNCAASVPRRATRSVACVASTAWWRQGK